MTPRVRAAETLFCPLRGPGRVEEPHNHRNQPIGAIHERDVSGAREHSELYIREADVIAGDTAAQQSKHLDHMLGTDDIRVPAMSRVGALIEAMASDGQSTNSRSSCFVLAMSWGQSCGCGAVLAYSSSNGDPARCSG